MRFSERTRRWAIRLAWACLLVSASLLIGLRLGRPLYYTDGSEPVAATTLIAGGMVRWNTPEGAAELPGPVQGRVAELADGRLIYGRTTADGTTDLVVFDPRRPGVPPEPAYGLNTAHNELAPAVVAGGRLYFASDRPEGVGGYDLYVAAATATGFGAPVPVTICNTALDETDPAPHPDGDEFVFVRIDRRVAEGRGGDLWQVRLDAGLDPTPVFAASARRRTAVTADRDPAFAPGGNALWFVRQAGSAAPQLQRASRLGSRYDAPQPLGSGWGTRHLRAPLPSADGLHLSLLQPRGAHGDADLWFRSTAEELPPWWPGQRWLEWILLGAAGVCALLLLLLHLGRRWSAMDLVAQCLLLSLLLHVLLFLWLMGVEIASSPLPGDADEGRMEVMVVTSAAPVATSEAPAATDVAARVQFANAPQQVAVVAPAAAPAAVARTLAVAETTASWQPEVTRGAVDAETPLQDRALEWGRRSDVAAEAAPDAARTPDALPLAAVAAAAGTAARAADGAAAVTVAPPTASVPNHTEPRALRTAATAVPFAEARPLASPASTLLDATAAARPVREAVESPMAVVAATSTVATAAAPVAPATERPEAADAAVSVRVLPPGPPPAANVTRSPLPAAAALAMTAPPALSETEPAARAHAAAARVRDAEPGLATDTPVLAGELPVRAVAPIATEGPAHRGAAVDAARGSAAAPTPPPFVLPVTDLARVSGAVRVPTAGSLPHAVAIAPPMPRAVVAVRDPAASERTSVPGPHAVAAVTVARAAESTATTPLRAAEVGAPERGITRRAVADPVTPPGSHLARTAADPDLVRGRVPARPMVLAGATGVAAAPRVLDGSNVEAPVHAGAVAAVAGATGPGRAAGEPMAAPVGGAALAAPARAGAPAREELAEPPGSLLARARAERQTAARRDDAVVLPNARPQRPRIAVADAARAAARPSPPAPVAAGVPAAAVRIEPQPVSWPTFQRAPRNGAATEPPFAVVPPASLLVRQQATRTLPPQVGSEAPRSAYSNRFGPAKAAALETFGGSEATERAVADGLRYLARIQNADGTWGDRRDFDAKYGIVYVGKTALCVLAFLGAGHTPDSNSEHSRVVRLALDHLLSLQDPYTGAFGSSSCYGHGIATYALAECYGLTKSPALLRPLEDALVWILQHQGPRPDRRNRGGWGYFSPELVAEDDYARVSVTAWMVMALESARLSGIELPETVLPRAREYLELSFDAKNGWFRYNHKPSRLRSAWPTLPASTPAGAFCLLLLGADVEDEKVQAAVDYTVDRRPEQYRPYDDEHFVLQGQGNVYFWYYGSLCCFLAGGDAWQRWNERLRTVLPAAQSPDGSFAPIDVYAQEAGDTRADRSYTTAMCVLSLEVYYRYFTPLLLGR